MWKTAVLEAAGMEKAARAVTVLRLHTLWWPGALVSSRGFLCPLPEVQTSLWGERVGFLGPLGINHGLLENSVAGGTLVHIH